MDPPKSNAPGSRGGERCCGGESLLSNQDLVLPGAVLTYLGASFSHLPNKGMHCGLVTWVQRPLPQMSICT